MATITTILGGDNITDSRAVINTNFDNLNTDKVEISDYTDADIKTKYENNADTNVFTDVEKTNLGNQSGTNTGDQDLSGLLDKATYDPQNIAGDAFDSLNHTGVNHGIIDPGTAILSAGTPTSTLDVVAFDYFIDGVKYSYTGVTNQDPGFLAGEEFAYIGINEDGLVIKKNSSYTADDLEGNALSITPNKAIIEVGLIRSFVGGIGGNLDIIEDSSYFLNGSQKGLYLRSKFNGTTYDATAGLLTKSSTVLQVDQTAGGYITGDNKVGNLTNIPNVTGSSIVWNGTAYDIGAPATIVIDNTNYNPGAGLTAIPTGKFVTTTILHSVRNNGLFSIYGTVAYDTFSEALSAPEDLGPANDGTQIADVNAIATIVVKQGESTIREIKDIRHKNGADNLPELTEGTQNISTSFDGGVRESFVFTYILDTGVIYAELEKVGGGDLTIQIDGSSYILDCTTSTGTGGKARIGLTPGTATVIQKNYLYTNLVAGVATLQTQTTRPSGDLALMGEGLLLDTARFTADGDNPQSHQNFNNAASLDGEGIIIRAADRLRQEGVHYESGVDPSLTVTPNGGAIDNVELATTAGIVWQFNRQSFDELTLPNTYTIINHPTTPFLEVTDLGSIDVDANGDTLRANNDRYGLNIFGQQNSGPTPDKLYVTLPNGKYSSDSTALSDINNYAVTQIDTDLAQNMFRIGRVVLKYGTAASGTFTNLVGGNEIQDERGFSFGGGGGGAGSGATTNFSDGTFSIFNSTDATKIIKEDLSGLTTATTRTYTRPDKSGTYALLDDITVTPTNTVTLTNKTLTSPIITTAINSQVGTTYTLLLTDQSKLVTLTNAGAIVLTIPTNASVAFPIGTQVDISQDGAGAVTVGGAGVTINSLDGNLTTNGQYVGATLIKTGTDVWNLYGNLTA